MEVQTSDDAFASASAASASAAAAVHASAEASDDAFAAVVAAEAAVVAGKGEVQSQQNARVPAAAGAEVGKLMQT